MRRRSVAGAGKAPDQGSSREWRAVSRRGNGRGSEIEGLTLRGPYPASGLVGSGRKPDSEWGNAQAANWGKCCIEQARGFWTIGKTKRVIKTSRRLLRLFDGTVEATLAKVALPCRFAVFLLFSSLIACSGVDVVQPREMDAALEADFEIVSAGRAYFGHQSVGGNVMDGVADLQRQLDSPLIRIGTLDSLAIPETGGILLHSRIGQNEKPVSKCEDFRQVLDRNLGGRVDVALFKFCYVDFDDSTDVRGIFDTYSRTMDDLKQRYPGVAFIHVTAPLRSEAGGPGVWVREMLGRPNRSKLANANRNEFNRLLQERYGEDVIFDLAGVMSTYPDGRRQSFRSDGRTYFSLVPAYTDDGGHLNEIGRSYAAAEFVQTIARALRRSGGSGLAREARSAGG